MHTHVVQFTITKSSTSKQRRVACSSIIRRSISMVILGNNIIMDNDTYSKQKFQIILLFILFSLTFIYIKHNVNWETSK
jgi:hypothetical protein